MLQRIFGGVTKVGIAFHEVIETSLLQRIAPIYSHWRWVTDGVANVVAIELLKKHVGVEEAQEFAKAAESRKKMVRLEVDLINAKALLYLGAHPNCFFAFSIETKESFFAVP